MPAPVRLKGRGNKEEGMKRVLITGATGYIGRRLKERLLKRRDLRLCLLVRNKNKVWPVVPGGIEIFEGDTLKSETLAAALQGVEVAYYLIHSMGAGAAFAGLDRRSAENFRDACIAAGVSRIIYLGGLGVKESASEHLLSRIETGEVLCQRPEVQTIWFRAGAIIGSGSASFEIVRHLVQKLPFMVTPAWVKTRTQPIGVKDVLDYLVAAVDLPGRANLVVDIGAEAMSFKEMMQGAAAEMGLSRFLLPVPALSPRLSSYWLMLFTPVPYRVAAALVEGLKSETVVRNDNAGVYFPRIRPAPYREAVRQALAELEQDHVISRWCDSSGGAVCDLAVGAETADAVFRDRREVLYHGAEQEKVFRTVCAIGGEHGWYRYSFLWELRGLIDKLCGGYGLNRGRRESAQLRTGDALDFWKVADIRENRRLLLYAQMKLPGKAWLEFDIQADRLVQTAHFLPNGLLGRLYWYAVLPLHSLVFGDLVRQIVRQAKSEGNGVTY